MALFYLKKRELWYRPQAKGYTKNILDAGRFTEVDATQRATIDGVTKHSEADVKGGIWNDMQAALKRASDLATLWEKL